MSDYPPVPKAQFPNILAAKAVEEGIESLDFRRPSGPGSETVPSAPSANPTPDRQSDPRIHEQVSVGRGNESAISPRHPDC
jgi:hypothetical protein